MNLAEFVELSSELVADDDRLSLSAIMNEIVNSANNISSNPTEAIYQQGLLDAIDRLRIAFQKMIAEFNPGTRQNMPEIGAEKWFTLQLLDSVDSKLRMAQATPAVMRDVLNEIAQQRSLYVAKLRAADETLRSFGVEEADIRQGEAEGKITVPRDIFDNDLSKFEKEIKFIVRLLNTLNEIVTGSVQPLKLQTLSTTDPTIVIELSLDTAKLVGQLMAWAVATWGVVELNRKLRAETSNLNAKTAAQVKALIDEDTSEKMRLAIDIKVTELVGLRPIERNAEVRTAIEKLLKQLLERVERGFSIVVRAIEHVKAETEEQKEENKTAKEVNTIGKASNRVIAQEHMLALTYDK
ncbi:MAG: hypothetical protein ACOYLS_15640 [Polymorphobacter sp.]